MWTPFIWIMLSGDVGLAPKWHQGPHIWNQKTQGAQKMQWPSQAELFLQNNYFHLLKITISKKRPNSESASPQHLNLYYPSCCLQGASDKWRGKVAMSVWVIDWGKDNSPALRTPSWLASIQLNSIQNGVIQFCPGTHPCIQLRLKLKVSGKDMRVKKIVLQCPRTSPFVSEIWNEFSITPN